MSSSPLLNSSSSDDQGSRGRPKNRVNRISSSPLLDSSSSDDRGSRGRPSRPRKRVQRQLHTSSSLSESRSPVYTLCKDIERVSETETDTQDLQTFPALVQKHVTKSNPLTEGIMGGKLQEGMMGGKSKRHCCMFCKKLNTKMSTHLQRVHKDEPTVAQILALKKGDPIRRQAFIKLQNQGDFQHNWGVLSGEGGQLITKYQRKGTLVEEADYLACPHCKGLYQKKLLSKHEPRCHQRPEGSSSLKKGQCSRMGKLLLPLPVGVSSAFFEKVIGRMKDDDITRLVKADSLILKYGQRLFSRRDIEEHSSSQISGRLRELGRLCKLLRANTGMKVSTLLQAIDPVHFDAMLAAVRELGEFSVSTNMCKKGSLVQKIGYSLKKCVHILKADGIKDDDADIVRKCERFESLFDGDWYDHVSACASQSVQRARMNRPKLLPSLEDVEKVNHILEKKLQADTYPVLGKAVLASITIFNRKRGGEVQRMKCADYLDGRKSNQPEQMILEKLTETEKKLVSVLQRIEIRGKFNRPVPVLLTRAMISGIDKLLSLRRLMGIDSPYLFVSQSGERPYRGSAVLRELADEAQVSDPSLFTATSLRKQLATLSQALEISKFNQDHLATFLGHDIRIHRNVYCQPVEVVQKAKVASILLKVNAGVKVGDACPDSLEEENNILGSDGGSDSDSDSEHHDLPSSSSHHNDKVSPSTSPSENMVRSLQSCPTAKSKKGRVKRPWSGEEAAAVKRHLANCLTLNQIPQKHACEKALAAEPVLQKRTWKDIKYFVYNLLKKAARK